MAAVDRVQTAASGSILGESQQCMDMSHSLRSRLWLLFLAFLLLVIGSVTVMLGAVNSQRHDALLINVTGRQRMLSQQMTWLALTAPDDPALSSARARFEQTMTALRHGGATLNADGEPVTLPRVPDPAVQAQLDEAWQAWQRFDRELDRVSANTAQGGRGGADSVAALTTSSLTLLDSLDKLVDRLSTAAQAKVRRLQIVQMLFLLAALALLGWGYWFTQRRMVAPLAALDTAAQRMATGDFEQETPSFADAELDRLSRAFEAMRVEVLAHRHQLEARVRQRTRELATAFEFSQEITAQLELEQLLASVTDRARTLMDGKAAALCLLDDQQTTLRLAAGSGEGQASPQLRQPVTDPLPSQVIGQGKTVVGETACASCGFLRRLEEGQCVTTPLRAGDTTLGALCVARPAAATFEAEEKAAFALLANSAAVAVVNARLVEDGRIQAQQTAAQIERERLATELHDNLAQTLSFLNFKADQLEERIAGGDHAGAEQELAKMRGATTRAYGQVRAALTGLAAPQPEATAFAAQLAVCVEELREATGLSLELAVQDEDSLALPTVVQQQALHIVREALVNVWRHARAQRATVDVARVGQDTVFTVSDDGCGFAPDEVDENSHLGLSIMRARAERSGGSLAIHSQPGEGTRVIARFGSPAEGGKR